MTEFFKGKLISDFSENYTDENFIRNKISGRRNLTKEEIEILEKNNNSSSDWSSIFVSEIFNPQLIAGSSFYGNVVIGNLETGVLKHNDLIVSCGIYNSMIISSVIGDNNSISSVKYMSNYETGSSVILFNISELNVSSHPKFGNGIVKEYENESVRIFIEGGNENGKRAFLPFDDMIPADAYLWSRDRDDKLFRKKLIEITDNCFSKKACQFGFIGNCSVIKNTLILKDVKVGDYAYIKGALKLKNITVNSSFEEPSQIGEGVELVNGIAGYGSKIFYQAVAVRFVIGRNCQVKYGARVLNSLLGDNSTVSCCEILNNIIFPFHEQHHNTSFLIASTIMGQSNIAAGATIGSNHNSRSPDGEIIANRGFWPGLCTNFKHNSKFASFCLAAKGNYQNELNITLPFSMLFHNVENDVITIMPGYWFLYNMYAIARNSFKFKSRDKRKIKIQNIETDFLAPDTVSEMLSGIDELKKLLSEYSDNPVFPSISDLNKVNTFQELTVKSGKYVRNQTALIIKPYKAMIEYMKMSLYFAVKTLLFYFENSSNIKEDIINLYEEKLYTKWVNAGGQIIPAEKISLLKSIIKEDKINTWNEIHNFYEKSFSEYDSDKARYSLFVIESLAGRSFTELTDSEIIELFNIVKFVSDEIYTRAYQSRKKDYEDEFRLLTYSTYEEMIEVTGNIDGNDFLSALKDETSDFSMRIDSFLEKLLQKHR